jgi:general secretion pathway protein A
MYTAFYGLREKPFALLPDPRYLFLADSHREALAHLLYGIDQSEGFICITGEVGTGKTTLCRTLLDRLGGETEVAFLFNPSQTGVEMLQDIHAEFGLDSLGCSRSELTAELNLFLLDKKREKRRVLLIIDEAQNLSAEMLEEIRLLSNLETPTSKLIQIMLVGQPELKDLLARPELRQLRQRIGLRHHLRPFDEKELGEYVNERLARAGYTGRGLFRRGALRELYAVTEGIPRLVNSVCDSALLLAYSRDKSQLDAGLIREVAEEMELLPNESAGGSVDDDRGSGRAKPRKKWLGLFR